MVCQDQQINPGYSLRKSIIFLTVLLASLITIPAYAEMNMAGMDMTSGKQIMLPMTATNGVSAMAHLKDIHVAMSKMGMTATHHFMVMFTSQESNEQLTGGMAALKITRPDGQTDKPIMLMAMSNAFGSDITLASKGKYEFAVGTKLSDGKKRTFKFEYTVK